MTTNFHSRLCHLLNFLEDPNYPSVGPHLCLLGFTGLWHPSSDRTSKSKKALFYIIIAFFFSQYVKCLINQDSDSIKLILQYAPFHMGIVKSCFFHKYHGSWEELINYTAATERRQLDEKDRLLVQTIKTYINRNRGVTYFFWALAFFSNFSIFTEPYVKNDIVENGTSTYLHIFDGYTPFSYDPPGYYIAMFVQTVFGHVVSAYVVGWDTLVVSLMIFYAGQLKVAGIYCRSLIDVEDSRKSHQNIAEFHQYYVTLVKYQMLFSSLISPVMFIYLIVISVNLGVCIIQLVEVQNNLATLVSSLLFVVACLIQLFIFYWHSSEVTEESTLVSFAAYESEWMAAERSLRKKILLLIVTTTKHMAFNAGPFNQMSLSTFVGILRTSYSFYTLLHGTN